MNYNNYYAVSNDVKNKIVHYIDKTINIELLPNCYVEDDFNETNNKDENYIFCNSRLADGKGIENLLNVFAKISIKYPQLKLYLCGGEFHFGKREKILKYINQFLNYNPNLIKNIKILGKLKWNDIPKYIKNSKYLEIFYGI